MLVRAHNKGRFLQIALFIIGTLRFEGKSVPKLEKGGIEDLLSPGSKFAVLRSDAQKVNSLILLLKASIRFRNSDAY
jgi:hypothetical protein